MMSEPMPWSTCCQMIKEDLFRYDGGVGFSAFLHTWRWEPGFRIMVLLRLTRFASEHSLGRCGPYQILALFFRRICRRYHVHLHFATEIGGGLYLPHLYGIVVHRRAVIGRNCNLSQHVTIGMANRGSKEGVPTIGDRVYIGPGAVIFGNVKISNQTAIGANCVVNCDSEENAVIVGVPGKVVSHGGTQGYVTNVRDA